jgi:hypothetical protein
LSIENIIEIRDGLPVTPLKDVIQLFVWVSGLECL